MPYYTTIVYLIKKRLQKSFKKMKYIASILILQMASKMPFCILTFRPKAQFRNPLKNKHCVVMDTSPVIMLILYYHYYSPPVFLLVDTTLDLSV